MTILRAGLYERVSTEEQALRGGSVQAQIDHLTEYCEKNNIKIVDHYADEGISGSKPPLKRPALQRLLDDVQAGKIDIILFTKLDRWFRSVKEYFKVQEILEKHKVEWKTTLEEYDTTSANGRMAITLFLAIAQNERERNAERVRFVLENKRKNKEACFGGKTPPIGYKKELDENGVARLVKDPETEQLMIDFWDIMIKYNNINKAIRHIQNVYGVTRTQKTWIRIAHSEFYCGMYGGVEDYCEPYVSQSDWLKIQEKARTKPRKTKDNRIYLFAGFMRCPVCGHKLCGTYKRNKYDKEYRSYRCRFTAVDCTYRRQLSELKIEKYLLQNLEELLQNEIANAEIEKTAPKPKPKVDVAKLRERRRRLSVTYMAGSKTDAEYLQEDAELKALIEKAEQDAPPPERNTTELKELLQTNFKEIYATLDAEDKRRFWRSIIKEIKLKDNQIESVIFF